MLTRTYSTLGAALITEGYFMEMERNCPEKLPLRKIDQNTMKIMIEDCKGNTDKVLQEQFGISYNTWRKILAGKPIRRSVANRLESRIFSSSAARLGQD